MGFRELIKKYSNLLLFLISFIFTFIFYRLLIPIYDPYILLGTFELHHFDYGLILLILCLLILLFTNAKKKYIYILSGISLSLIADEFWFIRKVYISPGANQTLLYLNTLNITYFFIGFIVLLSIIVYFILKKSEKTAN